MDKEKAIEIIWDYMHVNHELVKADVIVALGSHDIRVANYAAQLWLDRWAPKLVCSGSGSIHRKNPAWTDFIDSTEAETFAKIAREMGVPDESIYIENQSQNTGDNLKFTRTLLEKEGIEFTKAVLVHKPYMERRTFATAGVLWSDKEFIVTSPQLTLEEYRSGINNDWWVHAMAGDLQRIKEYPAKGFQTEQEIPNEVWQAFEYLVEVGYDKASSK